MRKVCDGLVLKVTDVGDHDRALTLLTADEGKFYIIAKGARSVRSKVASLCRICAYIKCRQELKGGNDEYRRAADQTKLALDGMALPEVDYFFAKFLPSFELSIDEMDENFARTHKK